MPVIASVAVWGTLAKTCGEKVLAAVDAVGHVGRRTRPRRVVAGVEPRQDERPGRLVHRDAGLELRPARFARSRLGEPVGRRVVVVDQDRVDNYSEKRCSEAAAFQVRPPSSEAIRKMSVLSVGIRDDAGDTRVIDERGIEAALVPAVGPQGVVRGEHESGPDPLGRWPRTRSGMPRCSNHGRR